MATATMTDTDHDLLVRRLGLTPPLPNVTPITLWSRALGIQSLGDVPYAVAASPRAPPVLREELAGADRGG